MRSARTSTLLFFVVAAALAACGGGAETPTGGPGGAGAGAGGNAGTGGSGAGGAGVTNGLPCDVDQVLAASCRSCHANKPIYGAPMPLMSYDDLHAPLKSDAKKKVYEQISARVHDDKKPMPPPPNERVSDADAAILDAWLEAGAPKSGADCGSAGTGGTAGTGTGGTGATSGLSCAPDVLLQPKTPWEMPKDTTDTYVCYGVDVALGEKRHVTALAPLIDNPTIVHHMLLFSTAQSVSPTPTPCNGGSLGQLVGVWAPGGQALELPPEAGYPLEGTAHFALQVHYSNITHLSGEKDSSGYQLCTTDKLRPNDADIMAFGTWSLNVPAQSSADITCENEVPAFFPDVHSIAGMPHMHKLGTLMSTQLLPKGGGAPVDLGTADPWNFESQVWTLLDEKATIHAGDTVRARCAWDNPTNKDVHFGETTSAEMCFGFLMYYPRIVSDQWQWGTPALLSKCAPTP